MDQKKVNKAICLKSIAESMIQRLIVRSKGASRPPSVLLTLWTKRLDSDPSDHTLLLKGRNIKAVHVVHKPFFVCGLSVMGSHRTKRISEYFSPENQSKGNWLFWKDSRKMRSESFHSNRGVMKAKPDAHTI